MDAKTQAFLTNAFINAGVARDGHLYKLAEGLKHKGEVYLADMKQLSSLGFSSRDAFIRYSEKLIKAGLAKADYENGKMSHLVWVA